MRVKLDACQDRHDIPETGGKYFYGKEAVNQIFGSRRVNAARFEEVALERAYMLKRQGVTHVELYVTGLTPAVIAAAKALRAMKIGCTYHHWDKDSGGYFLQDPFELEKTARSRADKIKSVKKKETDAILVDICMALEDLSAKVEALQNRLPEKKAK